MSHHVIPNVDNMKTKSCILITCLPTELWSNCLPSYYNYGFNFIMVNNLGRMFSDF